MDQDELLARHEFASSLYADAIDNAERVEKLFKAEFEPPRSQGDGGIAPMKPARARAILEKFLTLLSVRAAQKRAVIPLDTSKDEQAACSRIEQWLSGYQRQIMFETKRNPWRDGTYWYLLRGRMCLEARFDPSFIKDECLPFRTTAHDPNSIFSVWGENGVGYYTKCYDRYAWDLKQEYEKRSGRDTKKKDRWQKVELPEDENEMVEVIEYWDKDHCGAVVGGELMYLKEHKYGFVPLAEARCMDTPLASMDWAYQSVLAPVADSLEKMYTYATKMAAAVDMGFWPTILITSPSGVQAYDGGTIKFDQIPPGATKVDQIIPIFNEHVLQQMMAWFQSDVQLGTLPDIAWGAEPSNLESGFAIGQVINQVMDKIWDKKINLELAFGWHDGHLLRLVEQYGAGTGVSTRVPVDAKYAY